MKLYNEEAKKMVGDGKKKNKYFVTLSYGWFMNEDLEAEIVPGIKRGSETIEMCDTLEEAEMYFMQPDLGLNEKYPSAVTIEDRLTGVLAERFLAKDRGVYIERVYAETDL